MNEPADPSPRPLGENADPAGPADPSPRATVAALRVDAPASNIEYFEHQAMACTWGLFIGDPSPVYARQAARAAFTEIDRLEQELSRFVPHSDIALINAQAGGDWVPVGMDALECLMMAEEVWRQTGGAFDPTIGALLRAGEHRPPPGAQSNDDVPAKTLPFPTASDQMPMLHDAAAETRAFDDSSPGTPMIPGAAAESAAFSEPPVGFDQLAIDLSHRRVRVPAGMMLDLGAIGKGFAVDRAIALLREWSITAALLHSGQSTAYALGAPPGQAHWPVAIRDPLNHAAILARLGLREIALSGSGTLLHGPHIIDPRTRRPASGPLGAWVASPSAAFSDAASTAMMVLSDAEALRFCAGRAITAWRATLHGAAARLKRWGNLAPGVRELPA
ncbi:MAG: FAD:protein FMN transferase [Phycisphaerae bacterium]